jgi:hypothetical protein
MDILKQQEESTQEVQETQPQEVEINANTPEQKTNLFKKPVSTFLGYSLIVLFAILAYAGVFWYEDCYQEPQVTDWTTVAQEMQERRAVVEENEVLSDYEVREDGVYFWGELIEGVDVDTFEIIQHSAPSYSKDKNYVYKHDEIIKGADPETFETLKYNYAKDIDSVFYYNRLLEGVDPETFEVTEEYCFTYISTGGENGSFLAKDKNFVFCGDIKLSSNSKSFEMLGFPCYECLSEKGCNRDPHYYKNKNGIYCGTELLENVDSMSFVSVGGDYFKDKDKVFYLGKEIEGADPETFVVLEGLYTRDKNSVFFDNVPMSEIDLETFEVVGEKDSLESLLDGSFGTYAKDSKKVYLDGEIIEGADPANCTADNLEGCEAGYKNLGNGYEIKGNGVYYQGELIESFYEPYGNESVVEEDILSDEYELRTDGLYYQNTEISSSYERGGYYYDERQNGFVYGMSKYDFSNAQLKNIDGNILIFLKSYFIMMNPNGYLGANGDAVELKIFRLDIEENTLHEVFSTIDYPMEGEIEYGIDESLGWMATVLYFSDNWLVLEETKSLIDYKWSTYYCFDREKRSYVYCGEIGSKPGEAVE